MGHGYPVFLDITGKKCVVIGGGLVAERKVRSLLDNGAEVTLIAPEVTDWLAQNSHQGRLQVVRKAFEFGDIDRPFLVVIATDNGKVNQQIAEHCLTHSILVNVADNPEISNFIVPSVVHRGSLAIAVSTDGNSPYLAKKIRHRLETEFGSEYEEFLRLMGSLREEIIANVEDVAERQRLIRQLVDSDILHLIGKGDSEAVKERIDYVLGSSGIKSHNCTCGN